jgi:uncharacterized damage-inducible protein DinB
VNDFVFLSRLAENNAWSNLRLHRACAKLSREEFEATRTGFFPSIPATLNHILIVDWYYIDAIEEGGRGRSCFASEIPHPDLPSLTRAQLASDRKLIELVRNLQSLDQEVRMQREDHVQVDNVVNTLMHLSTHQIHHRGQVHAMLSGTSVKPPQLDEFFMQEELPLREEELRTLGLPLV